jgi:RimJ/RimL family protein N-acetyltransferase
VSVFDVPAPRDVPDPPLLIGRRVALVPITPGDYEFLYRLSVQDENLFMWRLRGATLNPESFAQFLWQGVLTQFKIVARTKGEPIGLIFAYNADFRNQIVYLAMVVDPRVQGSGWVLEASTVFITYLFGSFPFRKIYLETLEFNYRHFRSGEGRIFHVEGCLRDYEYYHGQHWHKYLLAVERRGWDETASRFGVTSGVESEPARADVASRVTT